jgi:hypothetical protein
VRHPPQGIERDQPGAVAPAGGINRAAANNGTAW